MDSGFKKAHFFLQPFLLLFCIFSLITATTVFSINLQIRVKNDKKPINYNYLFNKVELPYKEKFLASKYTFPCNNIGIESLKRNGIYLNKGVNLDNIIMTFKMVDCDDTKGTGNLLIQFDKKYKDVKIPLSGFQTIDKYLDLEVRENRIIEYTLPSYYMNSSNLNVLNKYISPGSSFNTNSDVDPNKPI